MDTIQIRIDQKTKREAKRILDRLGLDMSSAVKIYLRQISRTKGIPFPLITENGFTQSQEDQLIMESNQTLKSYRNKTKKGYTSAKKLLSAI